MFVWGIAIITVNLTSAYQIRKLERTSMAKEI
jgi:hypothetical protein